MLGVIFERAHELFRFGADLVIDIDDLCFQLLDARMAIEQGRGLFGKLRSQRNKASRKMKEENALKAQESVSMNA